MFAGFAEILFMMKNLKNADDYSKQYHKMLYAVANGMSTLEVLTHFSADS